MLSITKNPIALALGVRPAVYPGYMATSVAGVPFAHVRPYILKTKRFESSKAPKRGSANVRRLTAKRENVRAPLLKNRFLRKYGIATDATVTVAYVNEP